MNRIVRSAAVLGMVTLASVATVHAQAPGRASFHVAGGITLPMGDFGDAFGTGWQADGGVTFGLGGLPFAVRIDAMYGRNGGDEAVTGPDVSAKYFGGLVGGQFNLGSAASPVKPYILAQAGMFSSKVSFPGGSTGSETDFAIAGGGGVGFGLGSIAAFVEGLFTSVMADPSSSNFIVARFGVRFGGGM